MAANGGSIGALHFGCCQLPAFETYEREREGVWVGWVVVTQSLCEHSGADVASTLVRLLPHSRDGYDLWHEREEVTRALLVWIVWGWANFFRVFRSTGDLRTAFDSRAHIWIDTRELNDTTTTRRLGPRVEGGPIFFGHRPMRAPLLGDTGGRRPRKEVVSGEGGGQHILTLTVVFSSVFCLYVHFNPAQCASIFRVAPHLTTHLRIGSSPLE